MMVVYAMEAADEAIVHYFDDEISARGEALILSQMCPNVEATVSSARFEDCTRKEMIAVLNRDEGAIVLTTLAVYRNGDWTDK